MKHWATRRRPRRPYPAGPNFDEEPGPVSEFAELRLLVEGGFPDPARMIHFLHQAMVAEVAGVKSARFDGDEFVVRLQLAHQTEAAYQAVRDIIAGYLHEWFGKDADITDPRDESWNDPAASAAS